MIGRNDVAGCLKVREDDDDLSPRSTGRGQWPLKYVWVTYRDKAARIQLIWHVNIQSRALDATNGLNHWTGALCECLMRTILHR